MSAPERIWLQDAGDYDAARSSNEVTWCDCAVDALDTEYVRADVYERMVLLMREVVEELRVRAQALILVEAKFERRGDTLVPRLDTICPAARDLVVPLLDLLRRAEAVVGRPPGSAPWLDDLLDRRSTHCNHE
jgi:hypothetical protein